VGEDEVERREVGQVGGERRGRGGAERGEEAQLGVDEAEEGAERGMAWQVRRSGKMVLQRDAPRPRPRQLQLGVGGAPLPCIHFRCDPVSAVVGETNYGSEWAGLHVARKVG